MRPQRRRKVDLRRLAQESLARLRFRRGFNCGRFQLSPRLRRHERRLLRRWIMALAPEVEARLPRMQVVSATEIVRVGGKILLDTGIEARRTRLLGGQADRSTQAVSYVRQRVLVLQRRLFRQPWLGQRMFYHELCHFLWPRLGTPARHRFAAHLAREVRQGVRGELGYSAQYCKDRLPHRRAPRNSPAWPEYVCESFCDTGAYYLSLAAGVGHRLRSVEFTLSPRYRPVRLVAWQRALAR